MRLIKYLTRSDRVAGAAMCLALVLGAASVARAATPALLVGPDLQPQRVTIQGLADGMLTYFDTQRRLQSEPASRYVQIRFLAEQDNTTKRESPATAPASQPAGLMFVELTDGQRLQGQLAGLGDQGQKLLIEVGGGSATAWIAEVPLERVRMLSWTGSATPGTREDLRDEASGVTSRVGSGATPGGSSGGLSGGDSGGDSVTLKNGDQIDGFVIALEEEGLTLRLAGKDAGQTTLPLDRLARVRLNNPRVEAASNQAIVRWRENMALQGSDVRIGVDSGQSVVRFHPALARDENISVEVPVANLATVDLNSRVGRLVSLAYLPMKVTDGGDVLGLPAAPTRYEGQLELHAPLTLRVELPAGASRLMANVELALPAEVPTSARAWADVNVSLKQGQSTLATFRLNSQQPTQVVNAAIDPGNASNELFIVLESGINGPVLDRVRLRDAVVLIGKKK